RSEDHDDDGGDAERNHRRRERRQDAGTTTHGTHSTTSRRKIACAEISLRNGRTVRPASASCRPSPNCPAYTPTAAPSSTSAPGGTLFCVTPPSSAAIALAMLGGIGSMSVAGGWRKPLSIAA